MHALNDLTLNEFTKLYLSKVHSDILDLWYYGGKWYVRVWGNIIPGSGSPDAADALRDCLEVWEDRCTP